ncbi:MAG: acetyl-CoA carboxylase biotin carboxyl carrier protein [Leptolyngbyaceae bacterium]|nr:acetyl-CoA carboxylase biotin carboxyl carrier protein [Leptolyngbyaceae bacterium]
MELNFEELRELLAALERTDISELNLKSDAFELVIRRGTQGGSIAYPAADLMSVPPSNGNPNSMGMPLQQSVPLVGAEPKGNGSNSTTSAATAPVPTPADKRWVDITSPMVGTFYRAPGPDEPAFVDMGDRIRVGQTVCIIEAMKLMNELEAEVAGEVVEILVQNGQPVEYGQVLMRVNPA